MIFWVREFSHLQSRKIAIDYPRENIASMSGWKPSEYQTFCVKCNKSVGIKDERKACNKVWHVECFRCGKILS